MSLAYSKCTIKFKPNDKRRAEREYSDRSLIEICGNPDIGYSLRGTDIANGKKEIFDIRFIEKDLYTFGSSLNHPDEIRCEEGTYRLWLNVQSRNGFHKELRAIFGELSVSNKNSPGTDSGTSQPTKNPPGIDSSTSQPIKNPPKKKTKIDYQDILIDMHRLSVCMQKGKENDAADLAEKLAEKRVRLQFKESEKLSNEPSFPIKVQIDCIDSKIKDKGTEYCVNVYPSTKVRELRAIFEDACDFPSTNQYFFVNGHLAYPESTMDDLEVEKNSLFVLFATDQVSNRRTPF